MAYSSIIGKPSNPQKLAKQIDTFLKKMNSSAPDVGDLFVNIGMKFNIKPEWAAAQSMYETGYFKFGGRVKPEWHNPAGIKCTLGNYDPETGFAKFNSWEEGIHAFYERLDSYVRSKDISGEGGKYDKCYGHWRYDRLVQMGIQPDTLYGLLHLYIGECNPRNPGYTVCQENIMRYANAVSSIVQKILATPVTTTPTPGQPGQPGQSEETKKYFPWIIVGAGVIVATMIILRSRHV